MADEIHQAICDQLHSAEYTPLSTIKFIHKAYGSTQTVVVALPAELAKKL